MINDYLESHSVMSRARAETIAQSSSEESSCSRTSRSAKQVTWKDASSSSSSVHRTSTPKKFLATMEVLKRKLRGLETDRMVTPLFGTKPQAPPARQPPHGILKAPSPQFSTHKPGWLGSRTGQHSVSDMDRSLDTTLPLSCPSDSDDTLTSSTLSTPLGSTVIGEEWVIESDLEENEDYFTPKLPSGWSSPPCGYQWSTKSVGLTMSASLHNLIDTIIGTTIDMAASTGPVEIIALDTTPDMAVKRLDAKLCQPKPGQIKSTLDWDLNRHLAEPDESTEPIQTPGEFIDDLASSLQYCLVICGLGLMTILVLAWCAVLLITSGALMISVFPAVFFAYGLAYMFTRTKCSFQSILTTTAGLGGGLVLGIGVGIVLVVEFVEDEIEALCVLLWGNPPIVAGFSIMALAVLFKTEASMDTILPNSIRVLLAL